MGVNGIAVDAPDGGVDVAPQRSVGIAGRVGRLGVEIWVGVATIPPGFVGVGRGVRVGLGVGVLVAP